MNIQDAQRRPRYFPPAFCSAWGSDEFGLWATLTVGEPHQRVIEQRMRWIEPGTFLAGSPSDEPERQDHEGPAHLITLTQGFWLADTACTQELWSAVMGPDPSGTKGDAQLPVAGVSWQRIQSFLKELSAKVPYCKAELPTEAQWEYACRAGTTSAFSFGMNVTPLEVNYNSEYAYAGVAGTASRRCALRVKSLPPNTWGLYEMHGNVWEWCSDGLREFATSHINDPVGPRQEGSLRTLRGGSFSNPAGAARSAFRRAQPIDTAVEHAGFRLCISRIK